MDKTGVAFPDFISTEKIKRRRDFNQDSKKGMRTYLLLSLLACGVILIFVKLFLLQVIQGYYYRTLSDSNRIKTIVIHAPRGTVFDRNDKPLVFNVPGFRETVEGKTKLIGREEAISLIAQGKKNLEVDSLREYPYKDVFSHSIGYLGQVSEEELNKLEFSSYTAGDLIGKMGIERQYESFLKGEDGKQLVEIDSKGKTIRKLGQTDPVPGKNVKTTLDLDLQRKAFAAMINIKKGAIVATTPRGEVLALISKPSFDPNIFTLGNDYKPATKSGYQNVSDIINDTNSQPFLNRAISGLYPPGSTFKLVTAASGLENNIIDQNYTVVDNGTIRIGAFSFANWYFTGYGKTEGPVNVVKAIKRSNDIFFYKLAEKVGLKRLSEMADQFFIGKALGIDLEGESKGLVPTDSWKRKIIGEPWFLGDTYHYGIGQGYLLATPLEVNSWAVAISNNGTIFQPHILKDISAKPLNKNFLSQKTTDLIRQGMIESCETGGVAWPLFEFSVKNKNLKIDGKNYLKSPLATTSSSLNDLRKVTVACKTGTAQHGDEKTLPHSWITLFAPAYDPEIVVTVLAEESGEGSNVAAPIAKKILEEWFTK